MSVEFDTMRIELEKSVFGGYNITSVDEKITELLARIDSLTEKNRVLEEKLSILARKIEEYQAMEADIKESILKANIMASKMEKDATNKANRIIADAQKISDEAFQSAKALAESKIAEYKMLTKAEEELYRQARADATAFMDELLSQYNMQILAIQSMQNHHNGLMGPASPRSARPAKEKPPAPQAPSVTSYEIDIAENEITHDDMDENLASDLLSEEPVQAEAPALEDDAQDGVSESDTLPFNAAAVDSILSEAGELSEEEEERIIDVSVRKINKSGTVRRFAHEDPEEDTLTEKPKFEFDNLQFGDNYSQQ